MLGFTAPEVLHSPVALAVVALAVEGHTPESVAAVLLSLGPPAGAPVPFSLES